MTFTLRSGLSVGFIFGSIRRGIRPVRYIGNELNSIDKSKELAEGKIALRVAMCFPDVYEIGSVIVGSTVSSTVISSTKIAQFIAETAFGIDASLLQQSVEWIMPVFLE